VRVLGFPIDSPQAVINRVLSDIGAVARLARSAPAQLDRMLELGEEIAELGRSVLEVGARSPPRRSRPRADRARHLDAGGG
jgi:hypothetical protein